MTNEFISIDVWKLIAQWGNLLVLFLLMKKFLFKPVLAILAKRQAEIDKTYADANTAQADALELRTEYETRLENAKTEATELVKTATQRAGVRSDEIIATAKQEVAVMKEKATADIERERKNAAGALKNDISMIALDIASKVVDKEIDAKEHTALIDECINKIGEVS